MALADTPFENALKAAFLLPTWVGPGGACEALGNAFSSYFLSATITTTVTGATTSTPPTPVTGTGTGPMIVPPPANLGLALVPTPASNQLWANFAMQIGQEVVNYITMSSCSLVDTGTAAGTGTGAVGCIVPVGQSLFIANMIILFTAQLTWVAMAPNIVSMTKTLLATCTVTTTDVGPGWVGTGIGAPGCIT